MTKFISPLATGFLKSLLFIIAILPLASCGNDDEPEPAPAPNPGGSEFIFSGTTTTYPVDAPESIYTSTKSTYTVAVAKDVESAVMCIQNADFLQGMPQLGEMLFQPITCSFDETANTLSLSSSAITPEIAGRPFPAFPITDYTATLIPGKSISLTFICTYRGTPLLRQLHRHPGGIIPLPRPFPYPPVNLHPTLPLSKHLSSPHKHQWRCVKIQYFDTPPWFSPKLRGCRQNGSDGSSLRVRLKGVDLGQ